MVHTDTIQTIRVDTIRVERTFTDYIYDTIVVNDTVYVVTKYGCGNKEVIECKVTRMTYISKFSFSVKGHYANGNFYNANFTEKSIGKNVFLNKEEAKKQIKF